MKHILITTIAALVLLGCGPSVDIHQASREGNIEAVEQHIATGTDVNAKDGSGRTPLHNAALKGRKEIAELLIAKGADLNAKNIAGWTPLHYAAMEGHKEVAELLIAKGADMNAKNDDDETPLDYAEAAWEDDSPEVNTARKEVAELLRKHGGKHGAIHSAARGGDIKAVREFLAAGTDVNTKDMYGKTPLDWAVEHDKPETSDLLRKHGGKTGEELKAEGK